MLRNLRAFATVLLATIVTPVGVASLAGSVLFVPSAAQAAPAVQIKLGQKLRAKRNCTVNGMAIKKGVVLTVVAVNKDDTGKITSVDLSLSGMTISGVAIADVVANFSRA